MASIARLNTYVAKPVDFTRFMEIIRMIDDFFVTVVQLPNSHMFDLAQRFPPYDDVDTM